MRRFVYRPEIEVYIRAEDTGKVIDISNDITSATVTRRLNAVSSATIELQNRDGRYIGRFKPMDRIIIFLARTKRTLVFSGYLDETPLFQLYPGPVTIQASCTLKLLQNIYFDPGLPFMTQFFQEHGHFLYDPQTGTLNDAQTRFGNFDQKGGWATALKAVLTEPFLGNFPANHVHITGIPQKFLKQLGAALKEAERADTKRFKELAARIEKLFNGGSLALTTGDTNDFGNTNASAKQFRKVLKKHGGKKLSQDQQYNAGVIWGVSQEEGLPDLVALGLIATAFAESHLSANALNPDSHALGLFQLLSDGYFGRNGWLAKAVKAKNKDADPNPLRLSGDPIATNPVHNTRAFIMANASTNYLTINNRVYMQNALDAGAEGIPILQSKVPYKQIVCYWERPGRSGALGDFERAEEIWALLLSTARDLKDENEADTGKSSEKTTAESGRDAWWDDTTTDDEGVGSSIGGAVGAALKPAKSEKKTEKKSQRKSESAREEQKKQGNGFVYPLGKHGKIGQNPFEGTHTLFGNWESDNAVDISAPRGTPVVAVAGGTIGSQIGALDSGDPKLQGLRLHLVTAGNEFYYAHLSQLSVGAGDKVRAGQLLGYSGEANGVQHLHFAQKSGDPRETVGGAETGGTPYATSDATSDAQASAEDVIQAGAGQFGFFQLQLQNTDFATANSLQGKRALANDVSLFEWIETMATAGGRVFTSLPNGDFYAFFPDYFRWFGERTAYWQLEDIEIVDLTIQLSDRDLKTHVFAAGSRFTDQIEMWDRILSQVASVEEQGSFNTFINFSPDGKRSKFDPISFLKRYGARPYQHDVPQVRHPLLVWMSAWMKFTELWSSQFQAEAEFTFMPELFPGGLVALGNRFTMYIEEVTHEIDRTGGYRTSATLKAPASLNRKDTGFGPLVLANPLASQNLPDKSKPKKRTKHRPTTRQTARSTEKKK